MYLDDEKNCTEDAMRYIGIDIATTSATVAIMNDKLQTDIHTLKHPADLKNLLQPNDVVIAEWTGAFARKWLETASKITPSVYIYNPRILHLERQVVGETHKDDASDARALAKLAHLHHTTPYAPHRLTPYQAVQEGYKLRALAMHAERYTRHATKFKQLLWASKMQGATIDLKAVETALKEAEKTALAELKQAIQQTCPELYETLKALYPRSESAILKICAYLHPIERYPSADALCRYAGLYDFKARSGTTTTRTRAKPGSKQLRTTLYQMALAAPSPRSRWNPYYKRLRSRNLPHKKALLRVMNRILREIYKAATRDQNAPHLAGDTPLVKCTQCGCVDRETLMYHIANGYLCEDCASKTFAD